MKKTRNPYSATKKRKAALAFLATRGITQPRPLYPTVSTRSAAPVAVQRPTLRLRGVA